MCIRDSSYTTGTLGTAVKTDVFTYRTSGWKDQLISYNGSSISYDAVGDVYKRQTSRCAFPSRKCGATRMAFC